MMEAFRAADKTSLPPSLSRLCRFASRRWAAPRAQSADPWFMLAAELDRWASKSAVFWWRDDDAASATPELDCLISMQTEFCVPLAIACIPERAEVSLALALATTPAVRILTHGWSHQNHAPSGEPSAELAPGRDQRQVCVELTAGRERLNELFGAKSLPVLTPPYNRLDRSLVQAVRDAGFSAVSVDGDFVPISVPNRNVHADVNDWRTGSAANTGQVLRGLVAALRLRRLGLIRRADPIGILTHHLAHDASSWRLTRDLLHRLTGHQAVRFPPVEEIFAS